MDLMDSERAQCSQSDLGDGTPAKASSNFYFEQVDRAAGAALDLLCAWNAGFATKVKKDFLALTHSFHQFRQSFATPWDFAAVLEAYLACLKSLVDSSHDSNYIHSYPAPIDCFCKSRQNYSQSTVSISFHSLRQKHQLLSHQCARNFAGHPYFKYFLTNILFSKVSI